jgi:hypothetical protein
MAEERITLNTPEEMAAIIAKLQAENAALKAGSDRKLSLKVTDKGGVSLYGLGRFPSPSTLPNGTS